MRSHWFRRIQRAFALLLLALWHGAIIRPPESYLELLVATGMLALAIWLLIDAREERKP